jgi:flagellar hook-basal body complex protein FliE
MISPLLAAKAYAAVQGGPAPVGAQPAPGAAFGELVKNVMEQAVGNSRQAEAQMVAHIQGKAELIDVVTAVASAESSLETVMAVRDQVISAYQEIMRMPI